MSYKEEDSLLEEKYLVISLNPERMTISSKRTNDLSTINGNDYVHNTEAVDIHPVTMTTTRPRKVKKSKKNSSSWIQTHREYFVLDKEQLGQMDINEKRRIKLPHNLLLTLKRRDDGDIHDYVKENGKLIHNRLSELETVEGYYFILWYDTWIDSNGCHKQSTYRFITGTIFHIDSE